MARFGLLNTYNVCDNCGKCIATCLITHNSAPDRSGLTISTSGPFTLPSGREKAYYIAAPTAFCDGCGACMRACPKQCIMVGEIIDMIARMQERYIALFTLPEHPTRIGDF